MTKIATKWKTRSGYDSVTDDNAGFSLLLETGDHLLTEASVEILLEDYLVNTKEASIWTTPTKIRTAWEARDGYSTGITGVSTDRITEQGDTHITEQGDTRVTEDNEFTTKNPTSWVE